MIKEKKVLVAKAHTRYIRVSPRKVRVVIDLIRGEKVNQALAILGSINKKPRVFIEKSLKSAISNARQNPAVNVDELFISKITADGGPVLKRFRAAAMGRATMIRHRTTHLTVELAAVKARPAPIQKKTAQKRKTVVRKPKGKK